MSLKIQVAPTGTLLTNLLLVYEPKSKEAAIVDPGGDMSEILYSIERWELNVKYIINTHEHPDHTAENARAKEEFPQAKLLMHPLCAEYIDWWTTSELGTLVEAQFSPKPDGLLKEGDSLNLGDVSLNVIHTPGHSPGSICLICDEVAIVGDLIFKGSVGRYDLPMSNYEELKASIKKLALNVKPDTLLVPGHGPSTTLRQEMKDNPFIRDIL